MARDATRRRVLTAAAAALPLVAAGCKGIAALGTPPKPAPDVTVATDAIAVETQLIARYGAVLAANPGLAGPAPAAGPAPRAPRAAARPAHRPGGRAAAAHAPRHAAPHRPVPGTQAAALGYLSDAEDAASGALLTHLATAPPSLAQLLASISASEATHALILGTAARHS